jgi:hypothetical protein
MDTPKHDMRWFQSRSSKVMIAFLVIAGFFLVTEHAAHVFGVLPYLLLLACPLIHLFHGGHGHGGRGGHTPPNRDEAPR